LVLRVQAMRPRPGRRRIIMIMPIIMAQALETGNSISQEAEENVATRRWQGWSQG
jgi:hypothetical protein